MPNRFLLVALLSLSCATAKPPDRFLVTWPDDSKELGLWVCFPDTARKAEGAITCLDIRVALKDEALREVSHELVRDADEPATEL